MIKDPPDRRSIWLATLVAAPVGAGFVTAVILRTPWAALPAFFVAVLHSILLGLPAYLTLRRPRWANLGTAIVAGAVAGMLPIGLLTIGTWRGVDGAGSAWTEWGKLVAFLAANGATAGAAFWATIRFWPANRAGQVDPEVFA